MRTWHHALAVFHGGTQQIRAITGKRARTRQALLGMPLQSRDPLQIENANLDAGMIGFVGHPARDELLVAFPNNPKQQFATLDAMTRSGAFFVVRVNEPTFKANFDIEV